MSFTPEDHIQFWLNRAGFLLRRELVERFAAAGLDVSAEEMALMMQIWRKPGQTPSALADATIRDRTTVTRFLDGMAKKGMIERHPDPDDRRRVIVNPAPGSETLMPRVIPVVQGLIADTMVGVSPEDAATTRAVLQQLSANLMSMRD